MKTPYDGYVRLQKRAVDEVKLSISVTVGRLAADEQARTELAEEVTAECIAAQADWSISTFAYLRDRRRRDARLALSQQEHEEALERLRRQAGEAYGALRVGEKAAQAWTERAERLRAAREQAEADDLSNARRLLRLRRDKLAERRLKTAGQPDDRAD